MPGENIQDWSKIAGNNGGIDSSINWLEGMPRAAVNDSARSMMAAHAKERDLWNGSIATTGSANAYAFTSGKGYTSVPFGLRVTLTINFSNTGAATLNMDGIGPVTIINADTTGLAANDLQANRYADFLYNGTNWVLLRLHGNFVKRSGDTLTGNLNITTAATPQLSINKPASGNNAWIMGTTAGAPRWIVVLGDTVAESGSNTGSNFGIYPYNDAGTLQSPAIAVNRASGSVAVPSLTVGLGPQTDPLVVQSTGAARIHSIVTGVREFEIGTVSNGEFWINDVTGGVIPFKIQPAAAHMSLGSTGYSVDIPTLGISYSGVGGSNQIGFLYSSPYIWGLIDGGGAYPLANASDKRLKRDLAPSKFDCLAAVLAAPLFQFKWRDNNTPLVRVGLVAQELHKVHPEGVIVGDDKNKMWAIEQNNMVALLIGAIQQLTERVAALEAKQAGG